MNIVWSEDQGNEPVILRSEESRAPPISDPCDHRPMAWTLTVRDGPQVKRQRFKDLDAALDALEERAGELAGEAPRPSLDVKVKQFEPVQQVTARIELAGPQRLLPSVHVGIDVRGDGSTEAYMGRLKREVLKCKRGESPYRALRRAVRKQQTRAS